MSNRKTEENRCCCPSIDAGSITISMDLETGPSSASPIRSPPTAACEPATRTAAGLRAIACCGWICAGTAAAMPWPGPMQMAALGDDVAAAPGFSRHRPRCNSSGLSIGGMLGQAFAIAHGAAAGVGHAVRYRGRAGRRRAAQAAWAPRIEAVTKANSVAPLADGTMERWFTDAYKAAQPRALGSKSTPPSPAPRRRASGLRPPPSSTSTSRRSCRAGEGADLGGVWRQRRGHAAGRQQA